jgi:NodT family efflux transporter outer membrane factor (OMF) lipoprotein
MTRSLLTIFFILVLSSCAVGPDYTPPEHSVSDKWISETEKSNNQNESIKTDWWTIFNDPQLEEYIKTAVAENNKLEAASANIRRARALRREAIAPFFPNIGSNFEHTRQGTSKTTSATFSGGTVRTIYQTGFDASWEIDIFGGTRRSDEAAQARLEGAVDEYRALLLSVLAETARNYYEVRGIQKRIDIFKKNVELQKQTYNLVKNLLNAGEANDFDMSRAQGQLELTQSRLPDLKAEMKAGIYRLSVLLGKPPEALLEDMEEIKPLPAPPDIVPVGLRSDILRRRPDVRIAERELAAATADIGVSIADLYPRFNLTGGIGRSVNRFSDLFDPSSNVFSIGQILQWPIFQRGSIRANINIQEAEAQQAVALYEQTVLDSLADAETALTRYIQKLRTRNRLQDAVKSRQRSVELASARFNGGEEDFLSVLDAERELTSAEDELVISEADTVLNLISLYAALGGGWEIFEEKIVAE